MQKNNPSVRIIIPVFGNYEYWKRLAQRALTTAIIQECNIESIILSVGDNLQDARNKYALTCDSDYICFLDADDELDISYVKEMLKCCNGHDVIVPAVHRYYPDGRIDTDQYWYTPVGLMQRNYIVVGAMIKTEMFKKVGGFRDFPALEDWDLMLRLEEAGAKFVQCPTAIYKIHVREGRNSNPEIQQQMYNQILNEAKQRRGIV